MNGDSNHCGHGWTEYFGTTGKCCDCKEVVKMELKVTMTEVRQGAKTLRVLMDKIRDGALSHYGDSSENIYMWEILSDMGVVEPIPNNLRVIIPEEG